MLPNVQIITNDNGEKYAFATGYGASAPLLAHQSHPNFNRIVAQWTSDDPEGFAELFDIPEAIERGFARLSQRVTVKGDDIYFDGDKAEGSIVDAILDFMDAGEEFAPLVAFMESLSANPLGDVRQGLFDWISGQKQSGNFTITPEGDVLGYKSVWSTDDEGVFRPGRKGAGIVNECEFGPNEYQLFSVGDVVEMPRSHIRNTPSAECGVGLHIGTWGYAKTFSGNVKLLVKFSPRDIVSLPSSTIGSNKLRVCRYTIVDVITEPLTAPLYRAPTPECGCSDSEHNGPVCTPDDGDLDLDGDLADAERAFVDAKEALAQAEVDFDDGDDFDGTEEALEDARDAFDEAQAQLKHAQRSHGRGGATSQSAKGRGKNPAQDALGRFSAGRPGSVRDTSTGRFASKA